MTMIKMLKVILLIVSIVFLGWIAISWIDVILHNSGNYVYQAWNFFKWFSMIFA